MIVRLIGSLFLHLLTNASDAMPQRGTLIVRAKTSVLDETEAVQIDFVNTGEGIGAENLKKIWEPFFTTKMEGKEPVWAWLSAAA
jgi:two-component system NtrC family sensor kinase